MTILERHPPSALRAARAAGAHAAADVTSFVRQKVLPYGLTLLHRAVALSRGVAAATGRQLEELNWRSWPALGLDRIRDWSRVAMMRAYTLQRRPRKWGLGALGALVALGVGYLTFCLVTIPAAGGLVIEPTPSALLVEGNQGELFATRGVFKGEKLEFHDLTPDLVQAVIAIEDRRFYQHGGIDARGLIRAVWRDLTGKRLEGASTISQQLARMMYLSPERTIRRKVQEAMLAVWLEHRLSKEEILARYLNSAYFGAGVYGVDAAAKRYFGKTAKHLTLSEAALLAGLVRAPSALAPHRNLEAARARADLVWRRWWTWAQSRSKPRMRLGETQPS